MTRLQVLDDHQKERRARDVRHLSPRVLAECRSVARELRSIGDALEWTYFLPFGNRVPRLGILMRRDLLGILMRYLRNAWRW